MFIKPIVARSRMMKFMNTAHPGRLAVAFLLGLASALAWAQAPAPAAAAPAASPAASGASAAAPLPNPLLVLPQWAQDKVVASRADTKVFDAAYKHGSKIATFCSNCHGESGHSLKPEVPNLAGQNTIYVMTQL